MLLPEQHCALSPGTHLSSLWRSAADFLMYFGNIKYTSGGADCPPDTSHLFSVLPFQPLPILWNVAFLTCITMEFHYVPQICVLSFTCIFSRCCLQYASVLQARIIFQAMNWLLFFISEEKEPLLVVSVITHIHNKPEYEASAHFIHVRQLLTASCGTIAPQCIIYYSVGFPIRKRNGFAGNV